jgi:hypothetical protein
MTQKIVINKFITWINSKFSYCFDINLYFVSRNNLTYSS